MVLNRILTSPGMDGISKQVGFNPAPTKCLQGKEELDGFIQWLLHLHTQKERERGNKKVLFASLLTKRYDVYTHRK